MLGVYFKGLSHSYASVYFKGLSHSYARGILQGTESLLCRCMLQRTESLLYQCILQGSESLLYRRTLKGTESVLCPISFNGMCHLKAAFASREWILTPAYASKEWVTYRGVWFRGMSHSYGRMLQRYDSLYPGICFREWGGSSTQTVALTSAILTDYTVHAKQLC